MNPRRCLTLAIAVAMVAGDVPLAAQAPSDFARSLSELAQQRTLSDSARLHRLFALDGGFATVQSQQSAMSGASRQRAAALRAESLVVATIDRSRLGPADQLNYDVFKRSLHLNIEGLRFPSNLMPVTKFAGPQFMPAILGAMPASTVQHYENIIARIDGIPAVLDQTIAVMDSGLAVGVTPPRVTLASVADQVIGLVPPDAMKSPLLAPFLRMPAGDPGRGTHAPRRTRGLGVQRARASGLPALPCAPAGCVHPAEPRVHRPERVTGRGGMVCVRREGDDHHIPHAARAARSRSCGGQTHSRRGR